MPKDLKFADQASHPAFLTDGRIVLAWVDRFKTQTIKARLAKNLYSDFEYSSEITIFAQNIAENNKDNNLGELLADMGIWNFGLPFADVLPSGKVLIFYYAGKANQMNLCWSRLTI